MTTQSDERIVIETPSRKRRRLLVWPAIVSLVGIALIADRSDGIFGLVLGAIVLAFFGPLAFAMLLRIVRNRPALVLDADGFTDHGSPISAGYVPWPEVQQIEERVYRRRIFVAIKVTDPAAFLARQSAWNRFLRRINGPTAAGDILIPDNVLPMPPAELVKTMRRMQRAGRRSGSPKRRG
jgi:hypothetical protein